MGKECYERIDVLHERITEIEGKTSNHSGISVEKSCTHTSNISSIESQLANTCEKVEFLYNEAHETRERLELQEERIKVLRTLCEKEEVRNRSLAERMECGDWTRRLKVLEAHIKDFGEERVEQNDAVKILQNQ